MAVGACSPFRLSLHHSVYEAGRRRPQAVSSTEASSFMLYVRNVTSFGNVVQSLENSRVGKQ